MVTFKATHDGYNFSYLSDDIGIGVYEEGVFQVFTEAGILKFSNAQQAFCHFRRMFSE
jgi:hypothetical protein